MGIVRWFIIAGAFNGVLLVGLLLYQNRHRNRYLALLMLGFSYFLIAPEIIRSDLEQFPHIIGTTFPILFTFGPLMLLYALDLNGRDLSMKIKTMHFVPSIFVTAYFLPFFLQAGAEKIAFLSGMIDRGVPLDFKLIWLLAGFHILFYVIKSRHKIRSLKATLHTNFSNLDKLNFEWLQVFTTCFLILWVLHVVGGVLWIIEIESDPLGINDQILGAFGAATIYLVGYSAISRPDFITGILEEPSRKSIVGDEEQTSILSKLESTMELDQPYLDPDLTLHELAKNIYTSPRKLSEVINTCREKNFYDFVNDYRVEESKRLLSDVKNNQYTILAIAYESGFRSKSTFNKCFKQKEGVSPSFYKKSIQQRSEVTNH